MLFLSSILGMNLFGCKFCKNIKVKQDGHLLTECSRKNFDSLLWATLTVFQVIKRILHCHQTAKILYSSSAINGIALRCCSTYLLRDSSHDNPSQRYDVDVVPLHIFFSGIYFLCFRCFVVDLFFFYCTEEFLIVFFFSIIHL